MNGTVAPGGRAGETYKVGMNLDEDQARNLLAELKPYLDSQTIIPINSEKPADA